MSKQSFRDYLIQQLGFMRQGVAESDSLEVAEKWQEKTCDQILQEIEARLKSLETRMDKRQWHNQVIYEVRAALGLDESEVK